MKILGLTRYASSGASSRLRSLQYTSVLAAAGIEVQWRPLFNDRYIDDLYARRGKSPTLVASAYARRTMHLLSARRYPLVWLEKEALPWLPALFDPGLLRLGPPYVVDYDDAVFHYYDQSRSALVRALLGRKIDDVMRHATLVIAGNRYLEARARGAGAPWVETVPTVVDIARYALSPNVRAGGVTIGWIGTPSTQRFLNGFVPVLSDVLRADHDRFVTVGARYAGPLFDRHHIQDWTEASEARQISAFDIGIMPLPDSPFERGKCGYKLIQYMACGKPVVASPVGANVDIVHHGENGFLARTVDEWRAALVTLRSDPQLRLRMGEAGRRMVEQHYSLQKTGPRLAEFLWRVAREKPNG
jgi:glycosyltransferase involved in cell wall biosynthesis